MIITGEKVFLKTYDKKINQEVNCENDVSKLINVQNEEIKNIKVNRKSSKTSNNDIYKNIKDKAAILKNDKRNIQEKVSFIQIQEQKVDNMEKKLTDLKLYYLQTMENGKQEEAKEKIKIRKIQKQVNQLSDEYESEIVELKDSEQILESLGECLKKINDIKGKLAQHKAKLLNLEHLINQNKTELECAESIVEKYGDSEDHISENTINNPLDFVFIQGDIAVGIIVDIMI
ncbi:hypothetical protein [Terrisporobacter glycolicus]|uniref:Uncharacterized protein n=1 Tax=Terrisporobacter glycolicus ATCC 14880 = DSM 1288 TaxID=1121315 RepID=A0ABZ2ET35_9FIRM|nr:hypothetical protein [Terrisporobacter glycolicus]